MSTSSPVRPSRHRGRAASTDAVVPPTPVEPSPPQTPQGDRPARHDRTPWTPIIRLALGFCVVTVLAVGPMSELDAILHERWVMLLTPGWEPFLQHVLDRLASQAVCLPVLAAVAAVIAWRRRQWRPLLVAAAAELAWLAVVGGSKMLFARPAPVTGDPGFGEGGLQAIGQLGVSYPSGHAAEAVLIYGTAVYLVSRYTTVGDRLVTLLKVGVAVMAINTVVVSFWLGWHWVSDLLGGLLLGGCLLAVLIHVDHRFRQRRG